MKTDSGVAIQWECNMCGKTANSKSNMKKHIVHSSAHTGEKVPVQVLPDDFWVQL